MGRFTGFLRPMPETTVFLVVSGTYTGMVLPHVPENTSFIVLSGTSGRTQTNKKKKKKKQSKINKHKKS